MQPADRSGGLHRSVVEQVSDAASIVPRVSDDTDIPPALIESQRRFDTARAAMVAASSRPGPIASWSPEDVERLEHARKEEVVAALGLQDAREAAGFGSYEQQKRLQAAARDTEDGATETG